MNASYNTPWFTVPYLPKFADKCKEVIRGLDTRFSFYLNKLGGIIKAHKDILPKLSNKDVVYKLCCKNCDASYVGQTSRQLKTRISEHRNHINRNTTTQSVINEHRLQFNHNFDWEDVKILDSERFLGKRLVSEMTFIKKQKNGTNLQSDTEHLDDAHI